MNILLIRVYFLSTCFAFILGEHNISIFSDNRLVYSVVVFLFSLLSFRVANDCCWTLHPSRFSYVCSDYLIKSWISNRFFEYMIRIIINGVFHLEIISRYIRFTVPPFDADIFFLVSTQRLLIIQWLWSQKIISHSKNYIGLLFWRPLNSMINIQIRLGNLFTVSEIYFF